MSKKKAQRSRKIIINCNTALFVGNQELKFCATEGRVALDPQEIRPSLKLQYCANV